MFHIKDLEKPIVKYMSRYFSWFTEFERLDPLLNAKVLEPFKERVVHEVASRHTVKIAELLDRMSPHNMSVATCAADHARHELQVTNTCMSNFLKCVGLEDHVRHSGLKRFLHLPGALVQVGSPRKWAPNLQDDKNSYIPALYDAGGAAIKKMLGHCRTCINTLLTKYIKEHVQDGWVPVRFIQECINQVKGDVGQGAWKVNDHLPEDICKEASRQVCEAYKLLVGDMSFMRDGSSNKHISFARMEPDPLPDPETKKPGALRVVIHRLSDIKYTVGTGDTLEDCVKVKYTESTEVKLNGVFVDKSDYLVSDWTLAALYSKIANVEQRRVLMNRHGLSRFITPQNSTLLDMDGATVHVDDPEAPSITRALIAIVEKDAHGDDTRFHIVVGNDGSTERVYHMPASTPDRSGGMRHCMTLTEWDALVGQPARLYAQA